MIQQMAYLLLVTYKHTQTLMNAISNHFVNHFAGKQAIEVHQSTNDR